ncbi:MAG TPA: hypothetical protein VJK27_14665 [Terriglobales bacterium]|jgi:hypothetical protein|nr:hypothetical protein [Terriglobales bacterium]
MANKRKPAKKTKKSKKPAARKVKGIKKATPKKKAAKKPAKKRIIAKKRTAPKKVVKKAAQKKAASTKKQRGDAEFDLELPARRSTEESGDLQGLSNTESADSESVDELVEEGNAFEAGVVGGVEDADEHDEREVHTHEVPEDDVPEEYLDEE